MRTPFLLLLLGAALSGCSTPTPEEVEIAGSIEGCGRAPDGNVLIREAPAWEAFWMEHCDGWLPVVDFGRQTVVALTDADGSVLPVSVAGDTVRMVHAAPDCPVPAPPVVLVDGHVSRVADAAGEGCPHHPVAREPEPGTQARAWRPQGIFGGCAGADPREDTFLHFSDPERFDGFLAETCGTSSAAPHRPDDDSDVIALLLGPRPEGGHRVRVAEVVDGAEGGGPSVVVLETVPGRFCHRFPPEGAPAYFATVAPLAGEATFEARKAFPSCGAYERDRFDVEVIERVPWCDVEDAVDVVVEDQATLEGLWDLQCADKYTGHAVPQLDFENGTVVGSFWGAKPDGGHSSRIVGVTVADDVVVHVERTMPGAGCAAPAVIAYPGDIVLVGRLEASVGFEVEERVRAC